MKVPTKLAAFAIVLAAAFAGAFAVGAAVGPIDDTPDEHETPVVDDGGVQEGH